MNLKSKTSQELMLKTLDYSLLLSTSVWVLLSPLTERRELNALVHGRCGERRSPKVQPLDQARDIEPGTSWLVVGDLTNVPTSHCTSCSR